MLEKKRRDETIRKRARHDPTYIYKLEKVMTQRDVEELGHIENGHVRDRNEKSVLDIKKTSASRSGLC